MKNPSLHLLPSLRDGKRNYVLKMDGTSSKIYIDEEQLQVLKKLIELTEQ